MGRTTTSKLKQTCCYRLGRDVWEMSQAMFWFLSPLLCCAPVCLVVAIVFFVQVSQNDVQGRIDQYNDAVEAWTTIPDPALLLAATSGWVFHTSAEDLPAQFSTEANYPQVAADDGVDSYTSLSKFSSTGVLFTPVPWTAEYQVFAPLALLVNETVGGPVKTVYSENALRVAYVDKKTFSCVDSSNPRSHQLSNNCPLECKAAHGYWHTSTHRCWLYMVVSEICFVVDGDHPTNLVPTGSIGCALDSDGSLKVATFRTTTDSANVDFQAVTVSVRSSADPWLAAAELTSGTFAFGKTAQQDTITAAIFMSGAVFLCLCPCTTAYCLVQRWRKRAPRGVRLSDTESEVYGSAGARRGVLRGSALDEDTNL